MTHHHPDFGPDPVAAAAAGVLLERALAAEQILIALSDEYNKDDACEYVKINRLIEVGEQHLYEYRAEPVRGWLAMTPDLAAEVIRLTAERDAAVAASQALATENARLVANKREIAQGFADLLAQLMAGFPFSSAQRTELAKALQAMHAFMAGEGK